MANEKISESLPVGSVIAWYGSLTNNFDSTGKGVNTMEGWALCNANNGTPDLQDKVLLGAGHTYAFKDIGGKAKITLTVDQMPSHTHGMVVDGAHAHVVKTNVKNADHNYVAAHKSGNLTSWENPGTPSGTEIDGIHKHDIMKTGGDKEIEILPPYYAIYFVMRIK